MKTVGVGAQNSDILRRLLTQVDSKNPDFAPYTAKNPALLTVTPCVDPG